LNIFGLYRQQGAPLRIHGGLPELLGAHLAQPFVALDAVLLLAFGQNVFEQLAGGLLLYGLRLGLGAADRRLGGLLRGLLEVLALGIAEIGRHIAVTGLG